MKWFIFALAFPLRLLTRAISPIHEAMHAILAAIQGQEITAVTWGSITIIGLNDVTIVGAYFMELTLYLLLSLRARTSRFSMFCFGVVHALILRAPISDDFMDFPQARNVFIVAWIVALAIGWYVYDHAKEKPTVIDGLSAKGSRVP